MICMKVFQTNWKFDIDTADYVLYFEIHEFCLKYIWKKKRFEFLFRWTCMLDQTVGWPWSPVSELCVHICVRPSGIRLRFLHRCKPSCQTKISRLLCAANEYAWWRQRTVSDCIQHCVRIELFFSDLILFLN